MLAWPRFEMPESLLRSAAEGEDYGAARRAWLASLPVTVAGLARRWSLALGRPFQPGGCTSWVAPARTMSGQRLVLKVSWHHEAAEELHEADGLTAWDGHGTVRLVDSITDGTTSALLLEACEPGTPLSDALPPREQDVIAAGLLRRLWIKPPPGHPFRPLQSMCDMWAAEFEASYHAAPPGKQLDPGLARAGIGLFRSLPATTSQAVLLATDLHPGNILAARRAPWLVIDPKPYVGDPAYDPLQYMLNFPGRLAADPAAFARRMADLLDFNPQRLRHWLFARCVQESVNNPHLRIPATQLAP
jgi:streptomycin 6-kinase